MGYEMSFFLKLLLNVVAMFNRLLCLSKAARISRENPAMVSPTLDDSYTCVSWQKEYSVNAIKIHTF